MPKSLNALEVQPQPISHTDIRAQLERTLGSPDFRVPDRDRTFLRYVVEEALAGRGDRIKAYSIAIEAFGRDASFDPQSDPVVRIEAGHVRRALERYYLTAGASDPVLITIPIGTYVPLFAKRDQGRADQGKRDIEVEVNGVMVRFGKEAGAETIAAVIKALTS